MTLGLFCCKHGEVGTTYQQPPFSILLDSSLRLYELNRFLRKPLSFTLFSNSLFTSCFSDYVEAFHLMGGVPAHLFLTGELFRRYSHLFTLEFKSKICTIQIDRPRDDERLKIRVRRAHLVEDAVRELTGKSAKELNRELDVKFAGEVARDAGGVSREFFYLLTTAIFSPDYGLFRQVNSVYWFTTNRFVESKRCHLLGILIGLAIQNAVVLPIRFPRLLYSKLGGCTEFGLDALDEIEAEDVVRSLREITGAARADVGSMELYFSRDVENLGQIETHDLIPDGRNVRVTPENVDRYVSAFVQWTVVNSVSEKYDEFARGFKQVCSLPVYKYISCEEFDVLISGVEVLDWEGLRWGVNYVGYTAASQTVVIFWRLFDGFSDEEKRKFLQFVTGSANVPVGGLSAVKLTIERGADTRLLPVAHTCMNVFSLPDYADEDVMRAKLAKCLEFCESFGFV
jgi:ubiquitin-protein ligase E3 A